MTALVLDASAAVDALLPTPRRDAAHRHLRDADVVAPGLIDTEVLSALARLERAGTIGTAEADQAVHDWGRVPCERVPADGLLDTVWALRHALRVADAHYVALARAVGAPLLTSDARLAAAPLTGLTVVLLR